MWTVLRLIWAVILRVILPGLLIAGGIASVIYGAKYRSVPVVEEREEEISIAPPTPWGPPPMDDEEPGMGGPPGFGPPGFGPPGFEPPPPFMLPPPHLVKVKKTIFITQDESEPNIIREVTVGGVAFLEPGKLKRTYSGQAPSLCPT